MLTLMSLFSRKPHSMPPLTDEQLVQNIRAAFDNFLSAVTAAETANIKTIISTDFRAPELQQLNQTISLTTMARGCFHLLITKTFGDLS